MISKSSITVEANISRRVDKIYTQQKKRPKQSKFTNADFKGNNFLKDIKRSKYIYMKTFENKAL